MYFVYTTNPNSTLYTNFTKHQLSIWKQMKDLHSIEQDWFSAAVGNWLIDMSESNYLGNFFWSNTYTNTWVCYIIFHHFLCWIVFSEHELKYAYRSLWFLTFPVEHFPPFNSDISVLYTDIINLTKWFWQVFCQNTCQIDLIRLMSVYTEYIHCNTAPLWVNIYYWFCKGVTNSTLLPPQLKGACCT